MSSGGKASHNLTMNANLNFSMKFNFNKKILISTKKFRQDRGRRRRLRTSSWTMNGTLIHVEDNHNKKNMFLFCSDGHFFSRFSLRIEGSVKGDYILHAPTPSMAKISMTVILLFLFHWPLVWANFHPQKVYSLGADLNHPSTNSYIFINVPMGGKCSMLLLICFDQFDIDKFYKW